MRGMGGMGGGMNMNMLRQAQKMQADMQKIQGELEEKGVYRPGRRRRGKGGGQRQARAEEPDHPAGRGGPSTDVELLQDMIVLAVNDAFRQADEDAKSSMSKLTGGLNLGL